MGSPATRSPALTDFPIPSTWTGVTGFLARDDSQPLEPGHIRLYSAPAGGKSAVPSSIAHQAELLRPLIGALPKTDQITDITALAAQKGAGLTELSRALYGTGKYTRPNKILLMDGTDPRPGLILARFAEDAPSAPVTATLYCLNVSGLVSVAHLGGVTLENMIKIKEKLCGGEFQ